MKKYLVLLFAAVVMLSASGCGSSGAKYLVGETVSTECASLTLRDAAFTVAVNNHGSWSSSSGYALDGYFTPAEYEAGNPFAAKKGSVLVWLEFEIANMDRDSYSYGSFDREVGYVKYNGKTYRAPLVLGTRSVDGENWVKYDVGNILLLSGEKTFVRAYIEIPIEPKSLDDEFEFIAELPIPNDKVENFTFIVNKND